MNNTQPTTWHFLIKVPYLGNLSVIYDVENKGFSHFPSDENKGLKSIAEICTLLSYKITYYRWYGVNKIGHIMLNSFSHMHHEHSNGFSIFMEEVLAHIFQSL